MKYIQSRLLASAIFILSMVLPGVVWAESEYKLTVLASPTIAGSFNKSSATLEAGKTIQLVAYANSNFDFVRWVDQTGALVSEQMDFTYTMPARDVQLTAEYEYNPANPANPVRNYWNKQTGEVIVDDFTTGQLQSAVKTAIDNGKASEVSMITVAGVMNTNDFGILNTYSSCTLLDLSRVAGVIQVPSYAFDNTNLEAVYLPATIESIGTQAFYGCKQLTSMVIYAITPPSLGSNVFTNVPDGLVVYVPASAISLYQDATGWKNFTILPIQEDIRSISVSLPDGTHLTDYTNMWLELTNTKSGQKLHYVMTDRTQYTFPNIIRNTSWNVVLRNERGDVFGQIDNVEVKDEDVTVTFASLSKPQNVSLSVLTPDGKNVTGEVQVTWTDASGNYLAQSASLSGLPVGYQANYRVVLSQELSMTYNTPQVVEYTLKDGDNNLTCQLETIKQVQLTGKVKDETTGLPLSGAVISASQTFGGKYSKTQNTKTDKDGVFTITVSDVPTSLAFAASDYVSQTVDFDQGLSGLIGLEDVAMKPIAGALISVGFTYTESVETGGTAKTQAWYSDEANVFYDIYNQTQNKTITDFNVQNGNIILLEKVVEGDVLLITAKSKKGMFNDVKAATTLDASNRADVTFPIVEHGALKVNWSNNENKSVLGILYDANGIFLQKTSFNVDSLTIKNLADADYTLVVMGNSRFFNSIQNLSEFANAGLVEGKDYIKNIISVSSGHVTRLNIGHVPRFDESKFYFTGENTSISANKSQITIGNYITLRVKVDFKNEYATSIRALKLIVDLPESCSFVDNSLQIGNKTCGYELSGNRVTVNMEKQEEIVRFCVIPTKKGTCTPSAFVQFDFDGETIIQPIGSAYFNAENLSVSIPTLTADSVVVVNGTAQSNCVVKVFDCDILVGQTRTLANGRWSVKVNLYKPYSHSFHNIYAEVETANGKTLLTDTKKVEYDKTMIQLKTITMLYNGKTIVFDQIEGSTSTNTYSYAPSVTDFTFIAQFTKNDTTLIKNLEFKVLASDGSIKNIPSTYSSKHNAWIGNSRYPMSNKIPVNVGVVFDCLNPIHELDSIRILQENDVIKKAIYELNEKLKSDNHIIVKDEENEVVTLLQVNSNNGVYLGLKRIAQETLVNKQDNCISLLSEEKKIYVTDSLIDNNYVLFIWDDKDAFEITVSDNIVSNSHNSSRKQVVWQSAIRGVNSIPLIGNPDLVKYCDELQYWKGRSVQIQDNHIKIENRIVDLLTAKCSYGTPKISSGFSLLFERYKELKEEADKLELELNKTIEGFEHSIKTKAIIRGCISAASFVASIVKGASAYGKFLEKSWHLTMLDWEAQQTGEILVKGTADLFVPFSSLAYFDQQEQEILERFSVLKEKIRKASSCLDESDEDYFSQIEKLDDVFKSNALAPSIDPSGYVYEGVTSNRLEGVTATAYYKEMVEDMYGDLHENIVKWDATVYAQENPLFTDENGMYAWDVPQGLWQVKFEKEGYETTYSEWLPVPPPQLDVNIAMTQNVQPNVIHACAFEDAVEVEFDKYMMPELLTTENVIVMQGDKPVKGTIELLNEEASYENSEETFASKVRFNAAQPFTVQEVTLMVSNRVKSYAGIRMQDDFLQTFKVEQEIKQIVCDSMAVVDYGGKSTLTVSVLPAFASKGKTLTVKTSSPMILGVETEQVIIGEDGTAEIVVSGELPGTAALTFSVEGTDKTAMTIANVEQKVYTIVATPTANIASGSVVDTGTQIILNCETDGAIIYYTLDGSCPCDNSTSRIIYDGTPIIINEGVTIKVIAVAPNGTESDVAEFIYTTKDEEDAIIQVPTTTTSTKDTYDISGRKVGRKAKGIIIRNNNGTNRKVLVK